MQTGRTYYDLGHRSFTHLHYLPHRFLHSFLEHVVPHPYNQRKTPTATTDPAEAYELLKEAEADLQQVLLLAPDESDGIQAIEEYDHMVRMLRNTIGFLSTYCGHATPELTKPF